MMIRHATGVPLLSCVSIWLDIQVKFAYPCSFLRVPKKAIHELCYALFFFLSTYSSTSLCIKIIMRTVLKSGVYYSFDFYFHAFLVQTTAFGFARVACLRVSKPPCVYFKIAPILIPSVLLTFFNFSNPINQACKKILNLCTLSFVLKKGVGKQPTTQISMTSLCKFT